MSNDIQHKDFKAAERQKLAEKGQAMPDGGFPIRNRADLKNAIQAYGRAADKAAAKAWIIKRAKALNLTDLLPEGWLDMTQSADSGQEFIEHYGVKGMKWGVRKSRNERQRGRAFSGRRGNPKPQTNLANMSDQELREIVNRMNLEQQYSRLASGRDQRSNRAMGAGAAFITGIAVNVARQQIQNQINARIGTALATPRTTTSIRRAVGSIGRTEILP